VEYAHVTSAELGSDMTRVLVVGKDRRFRSVAAALLTRRGCAVMLGDATTDLAKMAHGAGADVVVLDAGASLRSVAQETARIAALHPDIGVVVVGDEPVNRRSTTPVLAKWGSFETLYGAIERARPPEARSVRGGER
jgi:CheY-like chemotaxis protein